jgi:Icc-related predicted phosphoesterase
MMLWVMSDLHADRRLGHIAVQAPDFDVFVCAGDVATGDVALSIEMVAAIARGKPAVFVAGNHEWMSPVDAVIEYGRAAAKRHNVNWLELDAIDIGGVRFAGATLWTRLDARYRASLKALQTTRADVVVTHFPPADNDVRWVLAAGGLWVCGHHHGFEDSDVDGRRLIRNAVGYGAAENLVDSEPGRLDFVVEVGP